MGLPLMPRKSTKPYLPMPRAPPKPPWMHPVYSPTLPLPNLALKEIGKVKPMVSSSIGRIRSGNTSYCIQLVATSLLLSSVLCLKTQLPLCQNFVLSRIMLPTSRSTTVASTYPMSSIATWLPPQHKSMMDPWFAPSSPTHLPLADPSTWLSLIPQLRMMSSTLTPTPTTTTTLILTPTTSLKPMSMALEVPGSMLTNGVVSQRKPNPNGMSLTMRPRQSFLSIKSGPLVHPTVAHLVVTLENLRAVALYPAPDHLTLLLTYTTSVPWSISQTYTICMVLRQMATVRLWRSPLNQTLLLVPPCLHT